MNHSIYIIGDFGSGYTQYPDDFAKIILSKGIDDIKTDTQITLHRDDNLVYYCYYRKLLGGSSPRGYIGFSICFNSVYCTDIGAIFNIFERGVTNLAVSGRLIEFSMDGDLLAKVSSLYLQDDEIDRIKASLSNEIVQLSLDSFKNLPPVNYGSANQERHCLFDVAEKELPSLIKETNNIVIHKDSNYKSSQFTGYAKQLSDLNSINQELLSKNKTLTDQIIDLNKHSKKGNSGGGPSDNKIRVNWGLVTIFVAIIILIILITPSRRTFRTNYNNGVFTEVFDNLKPTGQVFTVVYATSDDGFLNVRDEPSNSGRVLTKLRQQAFGLGDGVLIEKGESWSKVLAHGEIGWCYNKYLGFQSWYTGTGRRVLMANKDNTFVYEDDWAGEGHYRVFASVKKGTIIADDYSEDEEFYYLMTADIPLMVSKSDITVQ